MQVCYKGLLSLQVHDSENWGQPNWGCYCLPLLNACEVASGTHLVWSPPVQEERREKRGSIRGLPRWWRAWSTHWWGEDEETGLKLTKMRWKGDSRAVNGYLKSFSKVDGDELCWVLADDVTTPRPQLWRVRSRLDSRRSEKQH